MFLGCFFCFTNKKKENDEQKKENDEQKKENDEQKKENDEQTKIIRNIMRYGII